MDELEGIETEDMVTYDALELGTGIQFKHTANVTEQLKAENAMLWVQKMNEIQSRVREIIYAEIIYA